MNSSEQLKVGPRAKCDQVVYEAIAKAAETILTGRSSRCDNNDNHGYRNSSGQNMTTSKMGGASSRFHLEIEEVPAVRSILQMWKRSLHVPLRLDVYYEYCTDPNAPEQNTRKELLERWCIDYLPSNEHYASNHNNTSPRHNSDETIAQLRQVVKRVVIQLRVLHSLTRMMPAYRLHHALMDDLKHGSRNHALSNLNRPLGSGPGLGGGYYHNAGNGSYGGNESAENKIVRQNLRDLVGGQINYSFYVSDTVAPNQRLASDATLFSSNTNNPFARHDLNPIPTPFGVLHLAVNYDEGLCVENVLANRAKRILEWAEMRSVPMAVPSPFQTSKDINGNGCYNAESHDHLNQQNSPMCHFSQSRAIPIQGGFTNNEGERLQRMQSTSSRSFHHSDGSHDDGQIPDLRQMSMPNRHAMGPLSASPNVVSDHFAQRHQMPNIDRPKSAEPGNFRDRIISDTGNAFGQQSTKVISGLSLALMGEDLSQDNSHEPLAVCSVDGATSSVPPSNTDPASIRQRLAFHHPPPSFDEQNLQRTSTSPNDNTPFEKAKPSSTYGYAYNNGIVIPPTNFSKSGLHGTSRGASPISVPIVNTPPQPMFIGSMQRGGTSGINSNATADQDSGRDQDVPFKNPTSLQKAPAENIGASGVSNSTGKLAHTQSALQIPGGRNSSPQYPKESLLPPLNSLDALASSPFTFAASQNVAPGTNSSGQALSSSPGGVSVFSSLVMGKGSAAFGPFDEGFPLALTSGGGSSTIYASSSMVPSRSISDRISRSAVGKQDETDNDCEDMPFAVDMEFSNQSSLTSTPKVSRQNSAVELGASSCTNMSSQVVTSLAHRCSTAGRLKLFSSIENQQDVGENSIVYKSFVEDQLKDFRSFSDSITGSLSHR